MPVEVEVKTDTLGNGEELLWLGASGVEEEDGELLEEGSGWLSPALAFCCCSSKASASAFSDLILSASILSASALSAAVFFSSSDKTV